LPDGLGVVGVLVDIGLELLDRLHGGTGSAAGRGRRGAWARPGAGIPSAPSGRDAAALLGSGDDDLGSHLGGQARRLAGGHHFMHQVSRDEAYEDADGGEQEVVSIHGRGSLSRTAVQVPRLGPPVASSLDVQLPAI